MRRTGTLQGRRGHAAFALALAACAVLLAFWAKAPAFGEEGGATGQTEVETVDVQFSNIFRPDGDYEAHRNLTGEQYAVGDVGGQIHASNNPNSTALSLPLEVGYTVGGAGYEDARNWIVVNPAPDGGYATYTGYRLSDTNGNGPPDHIDIIPVYPSRSTPCIFNERGDVIPITKTTYKYSITPTTPQLEQLEWDAPFEKVSRHIASSSDFSQRFPAQVKENGDIIITSSDSSMVATSVEFTVAYNPINDTVVDFIAIRPTYDQTGTDDPVEDDKPVDAPPVKGDTGITSSGTLQGANIPEGAEIALEAAEVTEGEEYAALANQIERTMLYGMFKVDMTVNGEKVHDGFGTLSLSFPVDAKYEGYMFRVLHLHEDGIVTVERAFAKDGLVTVKVTDLSTFALEIGEKPVADAEEEEAPKVPAKLDTVPAKADESPAALAATGDSMLVPGVLALALVGGLATMLVSRKAAEKRMK